jgi:hypothetical protein
MAQLLAPGIAQASSADFTLAGEPSTLFLTSATRQMQDATANVEIKSAAGAYQVIGNLTNEQPAKVLTGPGTYRVTRLACAIAVGVDRV